MPKKRPFRDQTSVRIGRGPVTLHCGDAIYHSDAPAAPDHPLNTSVQAQKYTSIVAIDCAYHFRPRVQFLEQSLVCLVDGGHIALADICIASDTSKWVRLLLPILGVMPAENMLTMRGYEESMRKVGYTEVEVEDVSEDVFPGFARFLASRGLLWRVFAGSIAALYMSGARFVIVSGRK